MRLWMAVLGAFAAPALAAAGEVEIALRAGQVVPFYEQSFRFDVGPLLLASLPGVSVEPVQDLRLDGRGGLAFGGGLAWYPVESFGLEARVDTADVRVRTREAIVRLRIDLAPLFPPLSTDLTIPADANLERLKAVSLNLKARTSGRFKAHASGGLSYLPALRFTVSSALQAGGPSFFGFPVQLARLALRAEAQPGGEGEGRLGLNVGGGFEWPLTRRLSAGVDARYFRFRRQTLGWAGDPGLVLSATEQDLLREVVTRLGPVQFTPTFFQLTGGMTIRF